jgi:hypothetical protein
VGRRTTDSADLVIDVEVQNLKHLDAIIGGTKSLPMAADAQGMFR